MGVTCSQCKGKNHVLKAMIANDMENFAAKSIQSGLLEDAEFLEIESVFPGISRDYVNRLWGEVEDASVESIVFRILDGITDDGYPQKPREPQNKRRRLDKSEEKLGEPSYEDYDEILKGDSAHYDLLKILGSAFPHMPMTFIKEKAEESQRRLYPTYIALSKIDNQKDASDLPYKRLARKRVLRLNITGEKLDRMIENCSEKRGSRFKDLLSELKTARISVEAERAKEAAMKAVEDAEEENERIARLQGNTQDCQCCFGDYPTNRMFPCTKASGEHWYCKGCVRMAVDTTVGDGGYKLTCMSTDDCSATFSRSTLTACVRPSTLAALERNEQQACIRLAGINSLETCPFCPYAAEILTSAEEDREFRCMAPDCLKVSCRLCKAESHIPLTCEEARRKAVKEAGMAARLTVEEAMSEALIRKCNKCSTPFIKEHGCNKMTCSRCSNIQCYVCAQSVPGYEHFDQHGRAGTGKCPLYDDLEARHRQDVEAAGKIARAKLQAERPELVDDDLKVKVSGRVIEDERQRSERARARDRRQYGLPLYDEHILNPPFDQNVPAQQDPVRNQRDVAQNIAQYFQPARINRGLQPPVEGQRGQGQQQNQYLELIRYHQQLQAQHFPNVVPDFNAFPLRNMVRLPNMAPLPDPQPMLENAEEARQNVLDMRQALAAWGVPQPRDVAFGMAPWQLAPYWLNMQNQHIRQPFPPQIEQENVAVPPMQPEMVMEERP